MESSRFFRHLTGTGTKTKRQSLDAALKEFRDCEEHQAQQKVLALKKTQLPVLKYPVCHEKGKSNDSLC